MTYVPRNFLIYEKLVKLKTRCREIKKHSLSQKSSVTVMSVNVNVYQRMTFVWPGNWRRHKRTWYNNGRQHITM